MLTGIVKKAYERHKKPVCLGRFGKIYESLWGDVFVNNPKIAWEPYPGAIWIPEIKGNRPYIDYYNQTDRIKYKKYCPEPGEIFFTEQEKKKYKQKGFIYIEPNVKGSYGSNKDWGFEKWQEVVKRVDYPFIQGRGRKLEGVVQVETPKFRDACALLSRADLFVGTDGGLHHAAAALSVPAVVVWGGLVGPEVLGYDSHTNLRGNVQSCGNPKPCQHCRQAMELVTIDMVVKSIDEMLYNLHGSKMEITDGKKKGYNGFGEIQKSLQIG